MENIKKTKTIFGSLARLNPERKKNDEKAELLINEIIEDFKENNKDLRKVKIINEQGTLINFRELRIGESYTLFYVFGKFHPTLRNVSTGNRDDFDHRVKITNVPFFITFKKNSLERAFNTSRVKLSQTRIEDEKKSPNYSYNPNVEGQQHRWKTKDDRYRVSYDVMKPLFKFFMKEFNEQYPKLKNAKFKGYDSIRNIEHGLAPTKKWITVKSKDGKDLMYDLKVGENEKGIRKKLRQMVRSEYDKYWKERNKKMSEPFLKKRQELKENLSKKIDKLLKENGINLTPGKFRPYGFDLGPVSEFNFILQFHNKDSKLEEKVKKLIKEDLNPYKLKNYYVKEGYGKDGNYFALLSYDTQVFRIKKVAEVLDVKNFKNKNKKYHEK